MSLGWWIAGAVGLVWIASLVRRRSADLPPGDDDGTLVRLVGMGFKVEAIRRFRARHGGGLKDAKEAANTKKPAPITVQRRSRLHPKPAR